MNGAPLRLLGRIAGLFLLWMWTLLPAPPALAQQPVVRPEVSIDQYKLVTNCKVATDPGCQYKLRKVLESGGGFYSTPFLPFDLATGKGDGYGEGADGPRAGQRHKFNPFNRSYPYLRLNGLDSQSCYECHNSIGSSHQTFGPALMRKPYPVGGSAGSNSNAFINPLFPTDKDPGPLTLFIRNPPHVFGTGYTQELGDELTTGLFVLRHVARLRARQSPGKPVTIPLRVKGIDFGSFTTTFTNDKAKIVAPSSSCPGAGDNPLDIGGQNGFTDDVNGLKGVACDLVARPFQWKGVASGVRHFARDALDFHFSMQAFEKFANCDCDADGLTPELGPTPEVSIGNLSSLVSFVTMMRPPVQAPPGKEAQIGRQIFTGAYPGLKTDAASRNMCATCHMPSMKVVSPFVRVEWPTNPMDSEGHPIDPKNDQTWPILPAACPGGKPSGPASCPAETAYAGAANKGALVTPAHSSNQLTAVRRFNEWLKKPEPEARLLQVEAGPQLESLVARIRRTPAPSGFPDYVIPLSLPSGLATSLQYPRLLHGNDGSIDVPLFSDLRTHVMGNCLSDPTEWEGRMLPAQGTDVAGVVTVPDQFLTRPLWGVADTGPWLHDGRARTLREAILFHGDSPGCSGSEAEPVIKVFRALSPNLQQDVVEFLLTLQLPLPQGVSPVGTAKK